MNLPLTPMRLLKRALDIYAAKTAVVCGPRRFSYEQYGHRVNRLANALLKLGIQKGDRVCYLGYNCHKLLEGYYGVPAIGAILVPLNIRLTAKDFDYILNECTPRVLFVNGDFVPQIEQIRENLPFVEHFVLMDEAESTPHWITARYEELLENGSPEAPYPSGAYPFDEDDVAEIFYTSGTTGKPKGVMLTHRNLYLHALVALATFPLFETDVWLHLIPLFHVNGWGTPHFLTAKGGTHVMMQRFDPEDTLRTIEKERVTITAMVPTMVNAVLACLENRQYDVSSLRELLIGGAPPPTGMIERAEKALDCLVHTGFGMSETCPLIAWPELGLYLDPEVRSYRARNTWGFPLIGVEFRVVDENGGDLPWDGRSVGELLVRGDMVMKGYYKKPEETEEALRDGWYHTGDLVSIGPDGSLFIKDRKKDIIISGGENISSLEVEQVLYSHPDILECAVVGKPDEKWGEVPVAFVVLREGARATADDIIRFAKERMARFKAPKEVIFIREFPRGGTGKILKSELRAEVTKS